MGILKTNTTRNAKPVKKVLTKSVTPGPVAGRNGPTLKRTVKPKKS